MIRIRLDEYNGKEYFQCQDCGLHYELKEMAQGCYKWCRHHKKCNQSIIAESVELQEKAIQTH